MQPMKTTDVLIIGAGPTGLSLACQFIRYNVDFVIIEKKEGVTPYSKAIGVHARTLEIYEQIGLAAKAIGQGTIAGKGRLLVGGEVRGEIDLSSIGAGLSPYPYVLMLEQSKTSSSFMSISKVAEKKFFGNGSWKIYRKQNRPPSHGLRIRTDRLSSSKLNIWLDATDPRVSSDTRSGSRSKGALSNARFMSLTRRSIGI